MTTRKAAVGLCSAIALLGLVRVSNALFHIAVIDEVMTSYGGDSDVQFVEVRMLAGSQTFVEDSVFAAFDINANYIADLLVVPSNIPNGGVDTRWIIGTAEFMAASGVVPDFMFPTGILPTGGGMVCFGGGPGVIIPAAPTWTRSDFANYVDCVAYGTFAGTSNATLNAIIGNSHPIAPDGHSLERSSITNDNETDFNCADPATPENNLGLTASLPATESCTSQVPNCPANVDGACMTGFGKGLLLVKEDGAKSKLVAKFIKGPAITQTQLGNPLLSGGTIYDLCIYGANTALLHAIDGFQVDRSAETTCDGKACWKAVGKAPPDGKGYKFGEKAGNSNGITKILVKGGDAGKSKALVKGKGINLPSGITALLAGTSSATIQLRASDGVCVSVDVTDVKKSDPDFFKAK